MKIKLDDKHYLVSDQYSFWITRIVEPKDKKPYEKLVSGYHRSIEHLLDSFIDRQIRSSEAESIKALTKDVAALKKLVKSWKPAIEHPQKEFITDETKEV